MTAHTAKTVKFRGVSMVSRKYLKDYLIVDRDGPGGRIRSEAVYVGGDYILSPNAASTDRRFVFCVSVFSWLCFAGALIPVSGAARLMHVILPFVAAAVPMYLSVSASSALLRTDGVMKRAEAERISKRLAPSFLFTAVMTFVSFAGLLISAAFVSSEHALGDLLFGVSALLISVSSAVSFAKCRRWKTVRKPD